MIDNPVTTTRQDTFLAIILSFLLVATFNKGDSMPIPQSYPIIPIYILKGDKGENDVYLKYNGYEMEASEAARLIALSKKEGANIVQVKAEVDGDIKIHKVLEIQNIILGLNCRKKGNEFIVLWHNSILGDKEKHSRRKT